MDANSMLRSDGPDENAALPAGDALINVLRLAIFRTVADEQNFSRAAARLAVTQPAVTGNIQALERALGTRLFDRHRRGVQLTPAGETAYAFAVTVINELAALRAQLADLAAGQGGTLALGATLHTATYLLPDILAQFHQEYPAAYVDLRILSPDAIAEDVARGRLDLGITVEGAPQAGLQAEPLWLEEAIITAPADHRLAGGATVPLAALVDEPFVIGSFPTRVDSVLDHALVRAGLPRRRICMQMGNLEGVKHAVLRRIGLGVVFRRAVAAELASGCLVTLSVPGLSMAEQFLLIYRSRDHLTPLARNLAERLRAHATVSASRAAGADTAPSGARASEPYAGRSTRSGRL